MLTGIKPLFPTLKHIRLLQRHSVQVDFDQLRKCQQLYSTRESVVDKNLNMWFLGYFLKHTAYKESR